ncbi:N-acetylmuramic acid 6-phosphate (MurNAc-6-P) etherase [Klebsiella sp. SORGH_AS 826]|nr:N-acetylmuramic acid 6-phosphate (MurNAc-6-P) etherase [Klebsiella sp. SORGH_AS_0826]
MNSSLTAAMQARRHPDTTHIDRLATADMLAMLHQDDKQISEAGWRLPAGHRPAD